MGSLPDISQDAFVCELIQRALEEDVATGDATTLALVPVDAVVDANILAKERTIVSGGQSFRIPGSID